MTPDLNAAADPRALAVLLHPHPDYGGNRFHPFTTGLFERLPAAGVSAWRFDFSSGDPVQARAEAVEVMEAACRSCPGTPVVLAGYSFGAGIAATIDDACVLGWYLLAPPAGNLATVPIGADIRAKMIMVPEHDQFSPRPAIDRAVRDWTRTSVKTAVGLDHFLGHVGPIVDDAVEWISTLSSPTTP